MIISVIKNFRENLLFVLLIYCLVQCPFLRTLCILCIISILECIKFLILRANFIHLYQISIVKIFALQNRINFYIIT